MKRPQTTWGPMFGILNAQGKPWTPRAFWSKHEALKYLAERQRRNPTWRLGRHRVAPVSVTVRARKQK